MKFEGDYECDEVRDWLLGRPEQTTKKYFSDLKRYCEWRKTTPLELLDEYVEARKSDDRVKKRAPEMRLKEYEIYLKELKKAPKSIRSYIGSVKSFYEFNDSSIKFTVKNAHPLSKKLALNADKVKQLIEGCIHLREKALICLLFQSGLAIGDALKLNYGDVKKELEAGISPIIIDTARLKTDVPFRTFIGEDTIHYLNLYLEGRREKGEEIGNESPLFVSNNGRRLSTAEPTRFIKRAADRVKLTDGDDIKKNKGRHPVTAHTLRSAFSSALRLSGLDQGLVEYFLGHNDPYSHAYTIYTDDELRKLYTKHEHVLSARGSGNIREVQEKLQDTTATVEGYRNIITDQARGITELRSELKDMKKGFDEKIRELQAENARASEKSMRLNEVVSGLERELKGVTAEYNRFVSDPAYYGVMLELTKEVFSEFVKVFVGSFELNTDFKGLDLKIDADAIVEKIRKKVLIR